MHVGVCLVTQIVETVLPAALVELLFVVMESVVRHSAKDDPAPPRLVPYAIRLPPLRAGAVI